MKPYQQTDKFLKALKTRIRREFNHLQTLSFDDLSMTRTKRETEQMFERLLSFNYAEYKKIVKAAKEYATEMLDGETSDIGNPDDLIEEVLNCYNPVTKYLYEPESERKRMRLVEEMQTAKEYRDRVSYRTSVTRCANLWYTQSMQYAIDIEDFITLKVLQKAGVKRVEWVSEDDTRTCRICRELNGNVYPIDDVPPKQHYNCRCRVIPYKEDLAVKKITVNHKTEKSLKRK